MTLMKGLKQKTIRGGFAKICSQGASFLVRVGSLVILARLLDPKDFGLVGMVAAVMAVFTVFRDFGLSAAAVQRSTITEEQASTLFWINILVGAILGALSLALAPCVVLFYHEPRLLGITAALSSGFLFNAAGVQHTAILERQMRFTALAMIDVLSWLAAATVGISMASHGFGYWSLVATSTITPLVYTVCVWLTTAWVPGRPHKGAGVRSMMRFGTTLTLTGFVMYIATNFEKVLLGRFWGADAVGIYGRAYQLISIPTDNLNSAAGGVAFAALSRLQNDPSRFRSCFLMGYSLVLSLTVPVTVACALFADDVISVVLGPKWKSAAAIFRLLAPTILVFATFDPLGWLLSSLGLAGRRLRIALVLAPVMIAAYVMGLPYGPKGIASAYSAAMTVCVIPLIISAVRGTVISVRDILLTVSRPLLAGVVAAGVALGLQSLYGARFSPLPRLAIGTCLLFGAYLGMLLYVMGQKPFYLDLLRGVARRSSTKEEILASA